MSKIIQRARNDKKLKEKLSINVDSTEISKKSQSLSKQNSKTTVIKSGGRDNKKNKEDVNNYSNVIYLGHIPHGFYENEMKKFFSQFGAVGKVKLFRSAITEGSKGYGFVEFESTETAAIVAEAMNGYYLLERQLVCHVIPKDKIHDGMFKSNKKRKSIENETDDTKDADQEDLSEEHLLKVYENQKKSLRNKQKKLQSMGIDFDVLVHV